MDLGAVVLLTLILGFTLLANQRTIGKGRWFTLLLIVLPVVIFSRSSAGRDDHATEWNVAAIIAVALNLIFWLTYGSAHPPGHKGEITVIGMEDTE